jgi:hypothetical protein
MERRWALQKMGEWREWRGRRLVEGGEWRRKGTGKCGLCYNEDANKQRFNPAALAIVSNYRPISAVILSEAKNLTCHVVSSSTRGFFAEFILERSEGLRMTA